MTGGLFDVLVQPSASEAPADLLDALVDAGVTEACLASASPATSTALNHPALVVYRGVGLLPEHLAAEEAERALQIDDLVATLDEPDVVFLGEVGLDRRPGMPAIDVQQRVLRRLLDEAAARSTPVLLHAVRAHGPLLEVLDELRAPPLRMAVHGYTGSAEAAAALCARGLWVSFGPVLLRPEAKKAHAAAAAVDADRLLLESDAPTHPPGAIGEVRDLVAALRGRPADQIGRLTAENARRWLLGPGPAPG